MPRRSPPQLSLPLPGKHGGRRQGAGRKRLAARPQVPHRTRPDHHHRFPVLVTVRLRPEWRGLRRDRASALIRDAVLRTNARGLLRICEYVIIDDHLHAVVEANDRDELSRGVKGFNVRIAHRLHRLHGRLGSVVADRYHARDLRTPREVRAALAYVLNNARKHGYRFAARQLDRHSSGPWSDAWQQGPGPERVRPRPRLPCPVLPPTTWLLRVGWRRHGLIDVDEVPGPAPASSRGGPRDRADLARPRPSNRRTPRRATAPPTAVA